jgi:CheY-like chemotaxis protein
MHRFKCILLIDDDEATNFLNTLCIEAEGLAERVEVALNGEQGLEKLTLLQGECNPELILLDINMPVMDGFDFLLEFEKLSLDFKPRVIVLTSSQNPTDVKRVQNFKDVGLINKPLTAFKLISLLNQQTGE